MKPLVSLAAIGALCAVLLAGTYAFTGDAIRANREAHAWRVAFELVGEPFPIDGLNWQADRLQLAGDDVLVRGSVQGYAGAIDLLAALRKDPDGVARLIGVRVTRHRETPGLGDFMELARSPWIKQFSQRPPAAVDAVTGATITSEAVKRGVSEILRSTEPSMPAIRTGQPLDAPTPRPADDPDSQPRMPLPVESTRPHSRTNAPADVPARPPADNPGRPLQTPPPRESRP